MKALTLTTVLLATAASAQVTRTTFTVMVNNTSFSVDQYTPQGTGPFPIVALGHGFSNSKDNVTVLAQALAAEGAVVVAPQFPFGSGDHARNASAMLAAVDAVVSQGRGDATRLAFGGHSAGGLSAWLAAAQRPSATRLVVLMDPVDSNGLGAAQVSNVVAPAAWLFTPPTMCNSNNNAAAWFGAKAGPKLRLNVVGATHCDPQNPQSAVCTFACPGWNAGRSALFQKYAVALVRQFLLPPAPQCFGDVLAADLSANRIDAVTDGLGLSCADAGAGSGGGSGAGGGGPAGGGAGGGGPAGGGSAGGGPGGGGAGGGAAGGAGGGGGGGGGAAGGGAAGGAASGGGAAGGGGGTAGGAASGGGAAMGGSGGSTGGGGTAQGGGGGDEDPSRPGCGCDGLSPPFLLACAAWWRARRRHLRSA